MTLGQSDAETLRVQMPLRITRIAAAGSYLFMGEIPAVAGGRLTRIKEIWDRRPMMVW